MNINELFTPRKVGDIELKNSIVMAPMTRSRAIDNIPNELMAEYYEQRSTAGLIITEGTSPSPNGLGYARIPGIFNAEQVDGWKKTTHAVHENNGKIFIQLMHCGRISHPLNMPKDTTIFAPSQVKAAGQMFTDEEGLQDFVVPSEMSLQDIIHAKTEFISAAKNAIFANFDGVEVHGANGYLLEQFLSPISNIRTDDYGGNIKNRCKFVLETVEAVAHAIGKHKTGIRLSPYGVASDMPHYPEIQETYDYLSTELNKLDIAYIHLVDHSAMGAPEVPSQIKKVIRNNFKNTLILCGGYDEATAKEDLENGITDLIAFGRPYINNPDLIDRFKNNYPMADNLDDSTFYTAGAKGYTDYPTYDS
ncbi:N-ethylmaleimide reductase [Flavobacterium segetis]|uniref:N-ethylmaleimide reductase n=1 Tax=Flavobacterium segetis TaxID=271157 RepID=A0A1M5JJ84_9FLAO|nr:alkene reductase [Flavobacterium segetis]SHG40646.1 N-ethylmaleimide reductase [Flavobacterium segetis]